MAKKLQKIFALLLTASMAMSLVSISAAAEETGEEHAPIEIEVGQTQEITDYTPNADGAPEDTWTVEDQDVATVEETGDGVVVTGVGAGETTITHTYYVMRKKSPCRNSRQWKM